jgi:hypothetical protein
MKSRVSVVFLIHGGELILCADTIQYTYIYNCRNLLVKRRNILEKAKNNVMHIFSALNRNSIPKNNLAVCFSPS